MADFAGAKRAMKQRLRDNWTATPILFENETAPVMDDGAGNPTPWIEFRVVADTANQWSIGSPGSNVMIDEGVIEITVFVPAGTGDDAATTHATALGELWRNAEFYREDEGACVRTLIPQVGVGSKAVSENPEGVWWAIPVTTPYRFYHLA